MFIPEKIAEFSVHPEASFELLGLVLRMRQTGLQGKKLVDSISEH
jgi:hypothetical protein